MTIAEALDRAAAIEGAVGAALVDLETGMCLGLKGGGDLDLELAAAGITEVVRAKMSILSKLSVPDHVEEILISLDTQYHLIRLAPKHEGAFFYFVFDRSKINLAMARLQLKQITANLDGVGA